MRERGRKGKEEKKRLGKVLFQLQAESALLALLLPAYNGHHIWLIRTSK